MKRLVIDGGTTNLRVSLTDEAGTLLYTASAAAGVRNTAAEGNNDTLRRALKDAVETVLRESGTTSSEIPDAVAYGMITSNVGLCEIPHILAPAGAAELRKAMVVREFPEICPFPIRFIPGVRTGPAVFRAEEKDGADMMRGEETEAVGLFHLLGLKAPAVFVLPGSHNKFIRMDAEGRITDCGTSVSGELLDALTHHTVLADSLGREFLSEAEYDRDALLSGAGACRAYGLGRAAFMGRILDTLGKKAPAYVRNFVLGAVLYEDVRALFETGPEDRILVAGKAPVERAFIDVLRFSDGREAVPVDPGIRATMGLAGAALIAG